MAILDLLALTAKDCHNDGDLKSDTGASCEALRSYPGFCYCGSGMDRFFPCRSLSTCTATTAVHQRRLSAALAPHP